MKVNIPYGRTQLSLELKDTLVKGVLQQVRTEVCESEDWLVRNALERPIGSATLAELAQGRDRVVIICSDHTRPVPSRILIPPMLEEIRRGNSKAHISLLIATGCHRNTTIQELEAKFGEKIVREEEIIVHNCDDESQLASIGMLPSGTECRINKMAAEADLLVSEGFIEPHFFAGFSGGRKSVLPGIASRQTVLGNHCAEFIAHPNSRTGILTGNPIQEDMMWAAEHAGLRFILNVVLGETGRIAAAFAGDFRLAHAQGCAFVKEMSSVDPIPADIVITSNNGYPLDQNVYQAVKGMTAAEAVVRPGGVIIIAARSNDGHGGKAFYEMTHRSHNPWALLKEIEANDRLQTVPDQWQVQIFARVLTRAKVIYVSECPPEMILSMNMIPASNLEEAMSHAMTIIGKEKPEVVIIPDGVSIMVGQSKSETAGGSNV